MPSHLFRGNNAATVLKGLQQTLCESVDALTSPKVAAEVQETLHRH